MKYDSTTDTLQHIRRVSELLTQVSIRLMTRATTHDASKLVEPEKSIFDEHTPRLRALTYGSEEYKKCLADLAPALKHHYAMNPHHPEFYTHGVDGMTLLDLIEMFCDWKAAGERHADGSLAKSIEVNQKRFVLSEQLTQIFKNTQQHMNW